MQLTTTLATYENYTIRHAKCTRDKKQDRINYKGFGRTKTRHYDINRNEKKGNRVEILGPYKHFYSGVPKEKRAKRGVSILVTKR
jgi:hypothetical protein